MQGIHSGADVNAPATTPLHTTANTPLHGSPGHSVVYYQVPAAAVGPPRTFSEKAVHQMPKVGAVYAGTPPGGGSPVHNIMHPPPPPLPPGHGVPGPSGVPRPVLCQAQGPPGGMPVYYSTIPSEATLQVAKSGNQPSGVTMTTKPYAIVNALPPPQSSDVGYVLHSSKPGMLHGGGPGSSSKQHMIQMVSTTAGVPQPISEGTAVQQSGHVPSSVSTGASSAAAAGASPGLPPPPSYSKFLTENKRKSKVSKEDLQSIQKKIGDAFTQSSEVMLVSAFEEAWKKFQDNDKVYKEKEAGGPFVVDGTSPQTDTPGTSTLLHQMSTKPPNRAKSTHAGPSAFLGPKYIHASPAAAAGGGAQQQMVIQSVAPDYATIYAIPAPKAAAASGAQAKHQVHVTGLYYPAVETADSSPSQSDLNNVVAKQQHSSAVTSREPQPQPQHRVDEALTHPQVAKPHTATTTTTQQSPQTRRKKSQKYCARCGENATYLCSGCHLEWYCGRECQVQMSS